MKTINSRPPRPTHRTEAITVYRTKSQDWRVTMVAASILLSVGMVIGSMLTSHVLLTEDDCARCVVDAPRAESAPQATLLEVAEVQGDTPAELCLEILNRAPTARSTIHTTNLNGAM